MSELVDGQRLNDSKEFGIAKLAIEKGYAELTDKQKFVLKSAIKDFIYDDCLDVLRQFHGAKCTQQKNMDNIAVGVSI